jgi:hypothetical protein
MERNWQYVQEKINLIHQMNDGVKDQSKNNPVSKVNNPYSITPPGITIPGLEYSNQLPIQMISLDQHQKLQMPLAEEVSKMMLDPRTITQFKQPVIYDEAGVCTGDSCPIPKKTEKITWVDSNNQVSYDYDN